jgi:hypothetical protein
MKISRPSADRYVLSLGKREKQLFLSTIGTYGSQPGLKVPLSKSGGLPDPESNEKLLADALAEHKAETQRQLGTLLVDPARFSETPAGCKISLTATEVEWLLQALNQIRVGLWTKLGAPENRIPRLTPGNARDIWMMEAAGFFEMQLLEALNSAV